MKTTKRLIFTSIAALSALAFVACDEPNDGEEDVIAPKIIVENVTGISSKGVTDAELAISIENNKDYLVTLTPDSEVVTKAELDETGELIIYSVSANAGDAREGSIEISLDDAFKTVKTITLAQVDFNAPTINIEGGIMIIPTPVEGDEDYFTFEIENDSDYEVTVTCDEEIVETAVRDGNKINYVVSKNPSTSIRNGWIKLELDDANKTSTEVKIRQAANPYPVIKTEGLEDNTITLSTAGTSGEKKEFQFTVENGDGFEVEVSVDKPELATVNLKEGETNKVEYKVNANNTINDITIVITISLKDDPDNTTHKVTIKQSKMPVPTIDPDPVRVINVPAAGIDNGSLTYTIKNDHTPNYSAIITCDGEIVTEATDLNGTITYKVSENEDTEEGRTGWILIKLNDPYLGDSGTAGTEKKITVAQNAATGLASYTIVRYSTSGNTMDGIYLAVPNLYQSQYFVMDKLDNGEVLAKEIDNPYNDPITDDADATLASGEIKITFIVESGKYSVQVVNLKDASNNSLANYYISDADGTLELVEDFNASTCEWSFEDGMDGVTLLNSNSNTFGYNADDKAFAVGEGGKWGTINASALYKKD